MLDRSDAGSMRAGSIVPSATFTSLPRWQCRRYRFFGLPFRDFALGGSMLAWQLASPSFRNVQYSLDVIDPLTPQSGTAQLRRCDLFKNSFVQSQFRNEADKSRVLCLHEHQLFDLGLGQPVVQFSPLIVGHLADASGVSDRFAWSCL